MGNSSSSEGLRSLIERIDGENSELGERIREIEKKYQQSKDSDGNINDRLREIDRLIREYDLRDCEIDRLCLETAALLGD